MTAVGAALAARRQALAVIALAIGLTAGLFATVCRRGQLAHQRSAACRRRAGGPILLRAIDPAAQQVAVRFSPLRRLRVGEVPGLVPIGTPGRRPADPLLTVAGPPAGTYIVEATVDGSPGRLIAGLDRMPGTAVELGSDRHTRSLASIDCSVRSRRSRCRSTRTQPAAARSARCRSAPNASRQGRPGSMGSRRAAPDATARRIVFLVDGSAYMETAGAWVAGRDEAGFVIVPDAGSMVRLLLRNFAVDNVVTIDGGGSQQEYPMKPREERTVEVPVDGRTGAANRARQERCRRPSRRTSNPAIWTSGCSDAGFRVQ